jgi:ABC-2 type transport system permease protein
MTVSVLPLPHRPPRRALRELIVTEAKCAWRAPVGLALGVVVPIGLLVILGSANGMKKVIPHSSPPVTYMTTYVPVLICLVLVLTALVSLPIVLVNQREHAFLRRLSTTPVAPRWLLGAQVAVNLVEAAVAIIVIICGGALFYNVSAPAQLGGFVLAALLATASLFAIGLLIAAVAPNGMIAAVLGTVLLYPLMFFAGLWVPRQSMSVVMRQISDYTPLGAGVHAMLSAMQGSFPPAQPLLVMAGWAVVFGLAAVKLFRWE